MTHSVYLAARDPGTTKAVLALGLVELLTRRAGSVAVFRPVVRSGPPDQLAETVRSRFRLPAGYHDSVGVTYEDVHADSAAAVGSIIRQHGRLAREHDAVVVVGTDHTGVGLQTEFAFNAALAASLAVPVLLVVSGLRRTAEEVCAAVASARRELAAAHASELAIVVTRADPGLVGELVSELAPQPGGAAPAFVLPDVPRLTAPTVADLMAACAGTLLLGGGHQLGREVGDLIVGATSLPAILDRLGDDTAVIIPAENAAALLPGLIAAHHAAGFPPLAAVILTGGTPLPDPLLRLLTGMDVRLPVITTQEDTYGTATRLSGVEGRFTPEATGKIETALGLFAAHVDGEALTRRLRMPRPAVVTPQMFEYELLERARAAPRHIVLPEGGDERILRAADILLRRAAAELTLLGDERALRATAAELGLDVARAKVLSPEAADLRERFAKEYATLRAHRGMTVQLAQDAVTDVSYFGTLMVRLGLADGMVSGAAHPTAHTLRPAFEIIKTAPGTSVVSSVFFMCLADRVLVFGDCAVNPDPTAAQLAEIAISSAATAAAFGVPPRIAMLSYSTGASGAGQDVDKVRAATELVQRLRPDLPVEGPIQYDAAVDREVAAAKMPGSPVAGRATVLVVPDLNAGNILYKAVQRSAGAGAIGPILQGLNRPVNDLSRGATVQDIVNTVAVTVIQAS